MCHPVFFPMTQIDYALLLDTIISDESGARQHALRRIFAQDEFAVTPLLDQFYAGVNETTGLIIIHIIAEIGGYEANHFLDEMVTLQQPYLSWQFAAQYLKQF